LVVEEEDEEVVDSDEAGDYVEEVEGVVGELEKGIVLFQRGSHCMIRRVDHFYHLQGTFE